MTELETMYEQVAGKPTTRLVKSYRVGDPTLHLVSTSFFPDAPDTVTITDEEQTKLVTVRYTAKSATTLTLETTAVEYQPADAYLVEYPVDSYAYRPMTKDDYDRFKRNILALNAGKAEAKHAAQHENGGTDELSLDASQVTTGTFALARIPQAAMAKIVTVANDTARYQLTTNDVKLGDLVKVTSSGIIYVVVDTSKLSQSAGYSQYTASMTPHASTHQTGGADAIPNATPSVNGLMPAVDKGKVDLMSHFGTCSTASYTVAKVVSLSGFVLTAGARILVRFANANTAKSPTLNVNSTGAKPIVWMGSPVSADVLSAGAIYEMVYDGTNYCIVGDITRLKSPEVHGILIDDANSNPNDRVTIIGKSANWTDTERSLEYMKYVRHCVFKAAVRQFYVDEEDWSVKEDGTLSGVADGFSLDGNFGLEHATLWWRVKPYGAKTGLIEFTWDDPHESGWITAHLRGGRVREFLYTGVFEATNSTVGSTSNCMRSVYGTGDSYKPTVSLTNEAFHTRARNTGAAEGLTGEDNTYDITQPLTYTMRRILDIWLYKTTDFQSNVARGICDDGNSAVGRRPCGYGVSLTGGNTQGIPATSQAYTANTCAVVGGECNPYGNVWEHMGNFVYDGWDEIAIATDPADHLNVPTVTAANWNTVIPESFLREHGIAKTGNYIKEMAFNLGFPFIPKTVGGAATTFYADYYWHNSADTEATHTPRCCLCGAGWDSGSDAGLFCVTLYGAVGHADSNIGARLQAHSLT